MVLVVVVVVVVIVGAAVDVLILTFGIGGLLSAILLGLFPFVLILYLGSHYWVGLGVQLVRLSFRVFPPRASAAES